MTQAAVLKKLVQFGNRDWSLLQNPVEAALRGNLPEVRRSEQAMKLAGKVLNILYLDADVENAKGVTDDTFVLVGIQGEGGHSLSIKLMYLRPLGEINSLSLVDEVKKNFPKTTAAPEAAVPTTSAA